MRQVNGRTRWEKASEFLVNSREFTKEHASHARQFIYEKPILSTLLGIGAGLMVGLLFRKAPQVVLVLRSKEKSI